MDFLISCKKTQNDLDKLEGFAEEFDKNTKFKQNSVMTEDEEKKQDAKIDAIILSFTSLSNTIKNQIKRSIKETNKLKDKNTNLHVLDLRENHTLGHSKRLSHILKKFQNVQYNYRRREKDKLKETYLIACPDATEEQLKDLEDMNKADAVLASAFALGSNSSKAILNQAKTRKRKIEQIVEKISKLVELIEEIDRITQENTDKIDKIVITLENANENTEAAVENLETAREYQEGTNYFKRMFGYGGLILFAGVVLFLVLFLSRKSGESSES